MFVTYSKCLQLFGRLLYQNEQNARTIFTPYLLGDNNTLEISFVAKCQAIYWSHNAILFKLLHLKIA